MAYTCSFTFYLTGSPNTGQTSTLSGQYVNTAGSNAGSAITTGFVELGSGWYQFTDTNVTDGFRGSLVMKNSGVIKCAFSLNPAELENSDVKTSSISLAGSGSNTVTLTVQATGGAPIHNAFVTVKNTAETAFVAYSLTDINGLTSPPFQLNNGTYHVLISAGVGYQSIAPQTLVVSGTTTATYTLNPQSVTPPASLTSGRIYGTLTNPDLTPAANQTVFFTLESSQPLTSNSQVIDITYRAKATTDTAGYFQVDLLRTDALNIPNVKYRITCNAAKYNKTTALDTSTLDISTLP